MERKLAPLFSDFGSLLWSAIQTIFALAQWNELDFFFIVNACFLGLKSMTCTKNPPFQHFNNKAWHKSNPKGDQKKEKKILANF